MFANELITGDALLYRGGRSLLSRAIRWGTDSNYSHALKYLGTKTEILCFLSGIIKDAFLKGDEDMRKAYISLYEELSEILGDQFVIESDFSVRKWILSLFGLAPGYVDGVRVHALSEVRERAGSHDVYRVRPGSGYGVNARDFIAACLKYAAMRPKYDFAGLIWQAVIAAKFKFLRAAPSGLSFDNRRKFWCTEFAHTVDREAGAPSDGLDPVETTPKNYAQRGSWEFVGNLPYRISGEF